MTDRVRSRFLVHWTGKELDPETVEGCSKYAERAVRTIHSGLWLTPCREILVGGGGAFEITVPMTCFTEIRLSSARKHADSYGQLGFGFDRSFILKSGGSPVLYTSSRRDNLLMQRVAGVLARFDGIESLLMSDGAVVENGPTLRDVIEGRDLMRQICAFIKIMSEPGVDDYKYLDEAEWRVAFSDYWSSGFELPRVEAFIPTAHTALRENWVRPENIVPSNIERPTFFLRFSPDELKFIISPNDGVRNRLHSSEEFQNWLAARSTPMPILTLEECQNF